jgi:hypothetical protein
MAPEFLGGQARAMRPFQFRDAPHAASPAQWLGIESHQAGDPEFHRVYRIGNPPG